MSERSVCHILAPAKVNLGLSVLGKRPDGFHEIRTVFVALDLYDRLSFAKTPDGGVHIDLDPTSPEERTRLDFPLDERNLIVRAIRLLEQRTGRRFPVRVSVRKRIPTAAGLGGGSSDAAATLRAMDLLFGIRLSAGDLMASAAQLGSDVPFFLNGPAAVGEGRGELIQPISLFRDWWALLVSPPVQVYAADVYAQLDLTSRTSPASLDFGVDGDSFFSALRRCHNDLEPIVIRRVPELSQWQQALREAGAERAFVSGSGPTVVGVFRQRPSQEVIQGIQARSDQVRVIIARPVTSQTALVME